MSSKTAIQTFVSVIRTLLLIYLQRTILKTHGYILQVMPTALGVQKNRT